VRIQCGLIHDLTLKNKCHAGVVDVVGVVQEQEQEEGRARARIDKRKRSIEERTTYNTIMPCESCGVEFTVFRRKRSCFDCR